MLEGDGNMKHNLSWFVYWQDWADDKIKPWNIFLHGGFEKDTLDLLKRKIDKATFADAAKLNLMYHFWSKSEYEIILKNWLGKDCEIKIDVYNQVMLNFDKFIDYLWENKK